MKRQLIAALLLSTLGAGVMAAAPAGWFLSGERSRSYEIGEDNSSGKPVRYIRYVEGNSASFGTLMQQISARNYQGKRVRFQAMVKTQDVSNWAGLWMRIDSTGKPSAAFYNSQDKPIVGSSDWQLRSVTLDVPDDASVVSFGVINAGKGQVWIDQLSLEAVGPEVEVDQQPGRGKLPSEPSL